MMNSRHLIVNRFEIHDLLGHGGMGDINNFYRFCTPCQVWKNIKAAATSP